MSHRRLALAFLGGRQYYGRVLRSLQGLPDPHRCMQPVVDAAAASAGDRPLHVLEIGTWAGASAVSWATALRALSHGGKVTCVDAWRPYFNLDIDQDPVYAEMNVAAEHGEVFRLFLHNVRCAGVEDVIEYRVGPSHDVLPQLEPSSFDVIYVDGSHALDDAAADLWHATRLIRPGGILCGDDLQLQREEVDPEEHRAALTLGRDYVWAESARAHYHPGVTEAVARVVGRVFVWNGFWAAQRTSEGWLPIALEAGALPDHIAEAIRESADEEQVVLETVGETAAYNLVRLGSRYVAVAKAVGELSLGVDKIGERELEPVLLIGDSVEGLQSRVAGYEPPQLDVALVDHTATHNLVRFGSRYLAVDRALGPMSLGEERIGERELAPYILVGRSLEELRARLAGGETRETPELREPMPAERPALLSLILPTRGRPEGLDRFLGSVVETTTRLNELEIVLVMDEDDAASLGYVSQHPLRIVRTVVPPGLPMGQLNMAGYEACSGANVMLVNDDIIIQSPGWDEQVFDVIRTHPDGVYLIHVNDGIFQDKLCTFPLVSRRYCELSNGICPPEYRRYRIDDHIYNVFNLLSVLGRNRILYLPEVRFEHYNYVRLEGGAIEYQPDPVIHKHDTELFDGWLERRKDLAVALLDVVDRHRCEERSQVRRHRLAPITDSVSLRKPEYVQRVAPHLTPSSKTDRVTVGVISADITGDHAKACIGALKSFTSNFDLVIVDNNRGRGFNHAREMNALLDQCRTDYLVLLDDDVIVHAGWLDGLLKAFGSSVGVVTPAHKDVHGGFSYAGVVMRPDGSGLHGHSFRVGPDAQRIQTLCSAALIVDMAKCGSIRFDERYSKYFLDIDYGLRMWEAGYEVLCAPSAMVTHIGGATLNYGTKEATELEEAQRHLFVRTWMDTGRYEAIASTRWQAVPEIASLLEVPSRLQALMERPRSRQVAALLEQAHRLFDDVRDIPVLQNWIAAQLREAAGDRRPTIDDPEAWHLACLLAFTKYSVLVESRRDGLNVVLSGGHYFAVPQADRPVDARTLQSASAGRYLRAARLETLEALIEARVAVDATSPKSSAESRDSRNWLQRSPLKRVTSVDGFDIFAFEFKFFAVPTEDGPFDYKQYIAGKYPRCFVGHSVAEVRQKISATDGIDRVLVVTRQCPPTLRHAVERLLEQGKGERTSVLCGSDVPAEWYTRLQSVEAGEASADIIQGLSSGTSNPIIERLHAQGFTRVMLSWDDPGALRSAVLEQAAARIAPSVEVVFPDGESRTYVGEDAHRLGYNKAYLASLLSSVPVPTGQDVLEVGCSDGLVCDMMSHLGARRVTGIDVMETTGCMYRGDKIAYQSMDATRLMFPDASFDLVYSIATFEHLPHPAQTLDEIVRVLRRGGVGYVQAGPLYFSPFGHHMFAYFGDQPWIHLRRSKKRIRVHAVKRGIERRVFEDFGLTIDEYLEQMLSTDHINGLALSDYGLGAFKCRPDIEIVKFNISREGEDLLTPQILAEIDGVPPEQLTQHGFEILFRRRE